MSRYAAKTTVTSDASRTEIERTLRRYGADQFSYGWEHSDERNFAVVSFRAHNRLIRFTLPMPDPDDRAFTHTPAKGMRRSASAAEKEYEQAVRQRWRALKLVVQAKLEAVESGIAEFEEEFLAYVVLPGGGTVGQWARPQLDAVYEGASMRALPGGEG